MFSIFNAMEIEIILKALGLIGIGGLLKSAFDFFFVEDKKRKDQSRHEYKELRYKALLILAHALLNYENTKEKLFSHRPEIKSKDELLEEIKLEWMNMTLYASDSVIIATKKLIENQNNDALNDMVFSMRKSLYNIKTTLTSEDLKLRNDTFKSNS